MASKEKNNASGLTIPLPPETKRRRLTAFTKCIICQLDREEILRRAKRFSIENLQRTLVLRKDEVYDRLHEELPNLISRDVFWHSTCYLSYTSEQNVRYAQAPTVKKTAELLMSKHAEFQDLRLVSL